MLKSPKPISPVMADAMGRFTQLKFPFPFGLGYLYFRGCNSKYLLPNIPCD